MLNHPSVIIAEELEARGWDRNDLALAMVGGDLDQFGVTRLSLDFFFEVGPTDTALRIGDEMAAQLSRAFGVSKGFFLALEAAWLAAAGEPGGTPTD
jgi:hypothetical protein